MPVLYQDVFISFNKAPEKQSRANKKKGIFQVSENRNFNIYIKQTYMKIKMSSLFCLIQPKWTMRFQVLETTHEMHACQAATASIDKRSEYTDKIFTIFLHKSIPFDKV